MVKICIFTVISFLRNTVVYCNLRVLVVQLVNLTYSMYYNNNINIKTNTNVCEIKVIICFCECSFYFHKINNSTVYLHTLNHLYLKHYSTFTVYYNFFFKVHTWCLPLLTTLAFLNQVLFYHICSRMTHTTDRSEERRVGKEC